MEQKSRLTKQRQVILDQLCSVTSHPTAQEIYEMVRKKIPNISLGTVYRNLEFLSEKGEIRKLETAGNKKRFDANIANHYHVKCTSCGVVEDLPSFELEPINEKVEMNSSFKITGHSLEFMGICPKCQKNNC